MAQPPQGQQTINIGDLDIPQLSDVKKQLEEVGFIYIDAFCLLTLNHEVDLDLVPQELSHLTNSFAQLKQAQNKFKQCIENVQELGVKENKGP